MYRSYASGSRLVSTLTASRSAPPPASPVQSRRYRTFTNGRPGSPVARSLGSDGTPAFFRHLRAASLFGSGRWMLWSSDNDVVQDRNGLMFVVSPPAPVWPRARRPFGIRASWHA